MTAQIRPNLPHARSIGFFDYGDGNSYTSSRSRPTIQSLVTPGSSVCASLVSRTHWCARGCSGRSLLRGHRWSESSPSCAAPVTGRMSGQQCSRLCAGQWRGSQPPSGSGRIQRSPPLQSRSATGISGCCPIRTCAGSGLTATQWCEIALVAARPSRRRREHCHRSPKSVSSRRKGAHADCACSRKRGAAISAADTHRGRAFAVVRVDHSRRSDRAVMRVPARRSGWVDVPRRLGVTLRLTGRVGGAWLVGRCGVVGVGWSGRAAGRVHHPRSEAQGAGAGFHTRWRLEKMEGVRGRVHT